ncbi:MAG: L,D-transpeptidase family protein [Microthrixaceae bacterium]|nr:L,D-transpeptidase family protein [Microthrixaceae bacterium]
MAEEAEPTEVEEADTPSASDQPSKRRLIIAGAAALVVLVIIGGFLLTRGDKPSATPSTTSAPRRPTTTTIKELPAGTYEVASVKASVPKIHVLAEAPAEWESTPKSVLTDDLTELPPLSQTSAPKRPAIPSIEEPVTGRYATESGWSFTNPGPYDPPQPMTFLVTQRRGIWLEVLLPVRPNGTVGYIKAEDVDITTTQKRIEIHVADHKLVLYDNNEVIVESSIVTGVSFSPTPTGVFYVTDIVPYRNPSGFYGPYALATNGYSEMLNEFEDGVPVLAIHGTNRPELLGQDKSNGCIRLPNDVITKIAGTIGLGIPILIWP